MCNPIPPSPCSPPPARGRDTGASDTAPLITDPQSEPVRVSPRARESEPWPLRAPGEV